MAGKWTQILLRDAATFLNGDRGTNYPSGNAFVSRGVPFINAGHLVDGRIDWAAMDYITEERFSLLRGGRFQAGDVLFCLRGSLGKLARVPEHAPTGTVASSLVIIRAKPETCDPKYLYYVLRSPVGQMLAGRLDNGSAQPNISVSALSQVRLPLPSIEQQQAIARILGALDDKIDLNRKMNATLEAMARALFKSWFIDFDPVQAKAEGRAPSGMDAETAKLFPKQFVDSQLGPIPKEWTAVPVYDIATYVNGAAYSAFQPNDERRGLPIVKIAELKAGVTAQTKFSDVAMPEKYRLRTGDILFSWSGNPDTSIDTFVWAHGEAWLNQHIFRVDVRSPNDRAFVLAALKFLRTIFAEIARNKQTTGLGHVTAGDMQRLPIPLPNPPVVQAWARVGGPLFDQVLRNEIEALQLASVRDALLPRLMAGDIELSPSEGAPADDR